MLLARQILFSTLVCAILTPSSANPILPHEPCPFVGASVNTTSGTIIGHASPQYPDVGEYLGIPFAQPPIGNLRFQPPKAYIGNETITADKMPLSCIQPPANINYSQPVNWQNLAAIKADFGNYTSEDCLYLNVWNKPTNGTLKPVVVWFYGGGFHSGGVADASQNGGIWAFENDVVFVGFNYRLSIFGFSGAPGLTQNVAILDQRLAIEWVRDNAKSFGGDPSRIMIFGHSAGGASVDYYDYAWYEDPIIAASSPMSGTSIDFGNRYPNTTTAGWYEVSAALGCGSQNTTSNTAIVDCLRSKPAKDILEASQNATKLIAKGLSEAAQVYIGITGLFGPTIDNITIFSNYSDRAAAGQISHVPSLIGDNILEGCFLAMEGEIPVSDELIVTDDVFLCPGTHTSIWRANNLIPVWKYSWEGAYPNLYAPACPGKPWHGMEIYVMFNSTALATGQAPTPDEIAAGAYMRKAWSTLAHDPKSGLSTEMGWPTFNSNESNVVQLAHTNGTGFNVASAVAQDAICFSNFSKSMFCGGHRWKSSADPVLHSYRGS